MMCAGPAVWVAAAPGRAHTGRKGSPPKQPRSALSQPAAPGRTQQRGAVGGQAHAVGARHVAGRAVKGLGEREKPDKNKA